MSAADFFAHAAQSKAEQRGHLLRALGGLPAEAPEPEANTPEPVASFDSGARPL